MLALRTARMKPRLNWPMISITAKSLLVIVSESFSSSEISVLSIVPSLLILPPVEPETVSRSKITLVSTSSADRES